MNVLLEHRPAARDPGLGDVFTQRLRSSAQAKGLAQNTTPFINVWFTSLLSPHLLPRSVAGIRFIYTTTPIHKVCTCPSCEPNAPAARAKHAACMPSQSRPCLQIRCDLGPGRRAGGTVGGKASSAATLAWKSTIQMPSPTA